MLLLNLFLGVINYTFEKVCSAEQQKVLQELEEIEKLEKSYELLQSGQIGSDEVLGSSDQPFSNNIIDMSPRD
jgi:hypothetical protein